MTVGELLDGMFTSFRAHFGLFVGLMLPLALVQSIATMVLLLVQPTPGGTDPEEALSMAGLFILAAFSSAVISIIITAVAMAVTTVAIGEIHLGGNISIQGSYSRIKGRLGGVLGLALVYIGYVIGFVLFGGIAIAIVVGISALIHPAVLILTVPLLIAAGVGALWLLSRLGVALPALVYERGGVFHSVRRSTQLTKGFEFRVILLAVLNTVITYVAVFLFQGPFLVAGFMLAAEGEKYPVWTLVGQALGAGAGMALTGPLLSIGMALLYFDLRVRKEAFDLEIAMRGPAVMAPE